MKYFQKRHAKDKKQIREMDDTSESDDPNSDSQEEQASGNEEEQQTSVSPVEINEDFENVPPEIIVSDSEHSTDKKEKPCMKRKLKGKKTDKMVELKKVT